MQETIVGIIIAITAIAIVRWLWLTVSGKKGCDCSDCGVKNVCNSGGKNACQGCNGKCGGCS